MPEIHVNGMKIQAAGGTTVAVALLTAGRTHFRTSAGGEPRGPVCGMGVCMECRVTIDGVPHRLACQTAVRDGMEIRT